MAVQYSTAKSYQDIGIVQSVSATEKDTIEEINSFKTFFARPKHLRFEWEDKSEYLPKSWHIVWSDGKDTFTYWDSGHFEKEEDIGMGLAGATGISQGAAHTIPTLLLKEVGGFRLTEMERITLLREEQFEGENCFVVRGFHPFGFPIDLWISKKDFLLRKEREQNDNGTFNEEIRRNIKLNEVIPLKTFQYTPPKKKESGIVAHATSSYLR